MNIRDIRHKIANVRRHYGLHGIDMLACYDTAVAALVSYHTVDYVTLSISPSNWGKLVSRLDKSFQCRHPGSNVECLKVFDNVYIRKETRVPDDEVLWSKNTGTYTPTAGKLTFQLDAVSLAARSTKKQIDHANRVLTQLRSYRKIVQGEV